MRRLLAFSLVAACHGAHGPSGNGVTLATASASAVPAATNALPVGLATFDPPPAAAVAKNDHGVSLLAHGDATQATAELRVAVAMAPEFVLARYNLACALARGGSFDDAAKELAAVYDADFVGMRAHAASDQDLASFWTSDAGKRLAARVPEWEARYRAAIDRGVRAILWHDGSGGRGSLRPSLVRAGVWDAATRRFVAVTPPSPKAFFAYASSLAPYAIVAKGTVRDMLGGDLDTGEHLDRVEVYPVSTSGVPAASIAVDAEPQAATFALGASGMSLYVLSTIALAEPDHYAEVFDVRFGSPVTRKLLAMGAPRPTAPRDRPVHVEIGYNHWGYIAGESDPAYAYAPHVLVLPSGKKIDVPKALAFYEGIPRVVASPTGDRAVLLWDAAVPRCDPKSVIPGHFKMALVETATGAVTSLGEGDGAAAAAFTRSGALFLQRSAKVTERVGAAETDVPRGVLLVPNLDRDDECGF